MLMDYTEPYNGLDLWGNTFYNPPISAESRGTYPSGVLVFSVPLCFGFTQGNIHHRETEDTEMARWDEAVHG